MRTINIDLSFDNHLENIKIFGGYEGEHNESVLKVKLPERMLNIDCSGYRFDFQTSEGNKISSPLILISELKDNIISFFLTEQLTVSGELLFEIVALLCDENKTSLISKTNSVILNIKSGTRGNYQLIDPSAHKSQLQKMIDNQIEQSVDQSYNSESEHAQSGKAVAEALKGIDISDIDIDVSNKMDKFGEVAFLNDPVDNSKKVETYIIPESPVLIFRQRGDEPEIILRGITTPTNATYDMAVSKGYLDEALKNIGSGGGDVSNKMDKFGTVEKKSNSGQTIRLDTLTYLNDSNGQTVAMIGMSTDEVNINKNLGMMNKRIKNLGNPTDDTDAVNKGYVDDKVGNIEHALDSIIEIQNSLIGGRVV